MYWPEFVLKHGLPFISFLNLNEDACTAQIKLSAKCLTQSQGHEEAAQKI